MRHLETAFATAIVVAVVPSESLGEQVDRRWGLGTGLGGGLQVVDVNAVGGQLPAIVLPTLEFEGFLDSHFSVAVSTSLVETILRPLSGDTGLVKVGAYVLLHTSTGTGFVLGPGASAIAAWVRDTSLWGGEFGARVGAEFLTRRRGFAFQLLINPSVFAMAGGGETGLQAQVVLLLNFMGYATRAHAP